MRRDFDSARHERETEKLWFHFPAHRQPRIDVAQDGAEGFAEDLLQVAGQGLRRQRAYVLGLLCGELVAEAMLGREAPELALFEPGRLLG